MNAIESLEVIEEDNLLNTDKDPILLSCLYGSLKWPTNIVRERLSYRKKKESLVHIKNS